MPAGVQDEISLAAPPNEPPPAPVAVYKVKDPAAIVRAESNDQRLMVSGDGEGLVDVADVGLLNGTGVVQYSRVVPGGECVARRDERRRRFS